MGGSGAMGDSGAMGGLSALAAPGAGKVLLAPANSDLTEHPEQSR